MLTFKQFILENRLVHGTIRDHEKSIKKHGLEPGVSDYTKRFYDDPEPAVFMAHHKDMKRAVSSIRGQIGRKLNKHPSEISHDDIEKHGLLVTTRIHDPYSTHKINDDGSVEDMEGNRGYDDTPEQGEPGDYYSKDSHKISGIMRGKRLVSYLKKHKHI